MHMELIQSGNIKPHERGKEKKKVVNEAEPSTSSSEKGLSWSDLALFLKEKKIRIIKLT